MFGPRDYEDICFVRADSLGSYLVGAFIQLRLFLRAAMAKDTVVNWLASTVRHLVCRVAALEELLKETQSVRPEPAAIHSVLRRDAPVFTAGRREHVGITFPGLATVRAQRCQGREQGELLLQLLTSPKPHAETLYIGCD